MEENRIVKPARNKYFHNLTRQLCSATEPNKDVVQAYLDPYTIAP